jgi:meso-butanediol dehydrogenase / (S,S)-butanediol dehydrogenase / diacetyl reductase
MIDQRRFESRAFYVTGGGTGIGRAIALRVAAEGGAVAVSDIDANLAQQVALEIATAGGMAFATTCDVTDDAQVRSSIADAVARLGRLDVLATTAGGDWDEPAFDEITDELWNSKIDVNLTGVARCIRAALPALIAAGPGSNVVAIGSINGNAAIGGYPYSAAKAGLENLIKNLAARYGQRGVRFNLVTPGTIRTRNWYGRDDDLAQVTRSIPLGRFGEPEDVAAAACFLASSDAAFITGRCLTSGLAIGNPVPAAKFFDAGEHRFPAGPERFVEIRA